MTRAQFEDYRRMLERTAPNRARAVCELLKVASAPVRPNYKERRRTKRRGGKRQHRHPGRSTAQERRQRAWFENTPEAGKERELNRLVRRHRQAAPSEDGDLAGVLGAAAEFVVPQLLKDFDLDESHAAPLQHWLTWKFGQVIHDPDIAGYELWRSRPVGTHD